MFLTFETQSTASSCNITGYTDKTLILFPRIQLLARALHYCQTTAGQTWCSFLMSWHCLEGKFEKCLWIPKGIKRFFRKCAAPWWGNLKSSESLPKTHKTPTSQQAQTQGKLLYSSETEPEDFWRHPWVTRLALTVSCSIKNRKVINK